MWVYDPSALSFLSMSGCHPGRETSLDYLAEDIAETRTLVSVNPFGPT